MPSEPAVLFALMMLKAMMHFSVPLPKRLQSMPSPRTLVMLFAAPLAPMLKYAVVDSPAVTAMPFVPMPAEPAPEPVMVLPLIRKGLPELAIVTACPALLFPPMTWIPAPLGKFVIVLLLMVPAVMLAWFPAPRF